MNMPVSPPKVSVPRPTSHAPPRLSWRPGLRLAYVLSVTGVLLLTSILLGFLIEKERRESLKGHLVDKGLSLARTLAIQSEYGVLVGDVEGLHRLLEGLRLDPDFAHAEVIDGKGEVLASVSEETSANFESAQVLTSEEVPVQGGPIESVKLTHLEHGAETWLLIESPVITLNAPRTKEELALDSAADLLEQGTLEQIGDVSMVLSGRRSERALRQVRRTLLLVTLGVMALGVILSIPLAQLIVGPVKRLAKATGKIAQGDYTIHVATPSVLELAELARAFNQMTASLKERDARLSEGAAELERRAVALKTRQLELEAAYSAQASLNDELRLNQEQLRASNAELLHTSRLKSAFLASMSHELRTPLNSIIGFTECLLDGLDGPINEEQRESLERVRRNGRHLLELINDILDLSKIEAGQVVLTPSQLEPRAVGEECLSMVRPMLRGKPVTLSGEFEVPLPMLYADAGRVRQVLLNLLSNGVKFTLQGNVTLRMRSLGDGLELSVTDTGPGIPADKREEIFLEFRQLEGRPESGTGLGLAICKQLVGVMGGTIRLESEVGAGSTFYVWLPAGSGAASSRGGEA